MPCGNGEGVARCVDRGPEAADTRVAKVIRVEHGRVVHLVVGDAFDVTWPAKCRVDRYGIAARRGARVVECVRFVIVDSRETTTRRRLAAAGARAAVPANTILLL